MQFRDLNEIEIFVCSTYKFVYCLKFATLFCKPRHTQSIMENPPAARATRSRRPTEKAIQMMEQPKQKRRTKNEKARDDEAEELRKKGEAEATQESLNGIACLEDEMALVDAGAMTAHPRHRNGVL